MHKSKYIADRFIVNVLYHENKLFVAGTYVEMVRAKSLEIYNELQL